MEYILIYTDLNGFRICSLNKGGDCMLKVGGGGGRAFEDQYLFKLKKGGIMSN